MTGENSIVNSSDRGNNAGKETLTYGEYICPIDLDYIGEDVNSVKAHAISKHEEYAHEDEIRETSKKYIEQPLPGVEDQPTQETLTETTEDFNDEHEDTAEDTVLNEVNPDDSYAEVDSAIQEKFDELDTVEQVEREDDKHSSGGLISFIKSIFGL